MLLQINTAVAGNLIICALVFFVGLRFACWLVEEALWRFRNRRQG